MTKERIQKLMAQANVASRRASEDLITQGRVRVNGALATLGDQADPETDEITVDGTRLDFDNQKRVYIALNKPKNVLSTDKPHRTDKRQTVADLLHNSYADEHLFSVGRLDADSDGLVVMTNDGDLAFRLTHPKFRHTKTYRVEVVGLPTAETLEAWQQGIFLDDGKTAPCVVEIVKGSPKGTILRIVMTEGKKRQIRRVAAKLGHQVTHLTRTHIGMFALGDLASGQFREMTAKEVMALKTPAPEIKALKGQSRSKKRATIAKAGSPDESDESTSSDQRSNNGSNNGGNSRSNSRSNSHPRSGKKSITPRSKSGTSGTRDKRGASRKKDDRGSNPSSSRNSSPRSSRSDSRSNRRKDNPR